jgi:5,10-methylenetetrahydromethanopterin reductase
MSSAIPAISIALPPSQSIVERARLASRLGYRRLFVFDSPALYGDVWVALARVADSVPDIHLATGVAISSLRNPMVTASALATIEELAPGRVSAYFGTGFTGRRAMGKLGVRWKDLATYVTQVRGLLRGEVVDIDGYPCQMIHSPGYAPPRPINIPLGMAPIGPKGFAVARQLADSVILVSPPGPGDHPWTDVALLANGIVLNPDEDHSSSRVIDSIGASYTTGIHSLFEWAPERLHEVPGGSDWLHRINAERPANERHLVVHQGHLVAVTERDRPLLEVAGERLMASPFAGTPTEVARAVEQMGDLGVTEIAFNPVGPDIERDLEAFALACLGSPEPRD